MRRPPGGAIVIGGYVNGLGLVRSLAALRVPVAVVSTQPFDIAQHSRQVSESASVRDLDDDPDALVDLLERRSRAWSGRALFPTNDGSLAALSKHLARLSTSYRVAAPPFEVARGLLDKEVMRQAAADVGIPLPRTHGPASKDMVEALDERDFPVLIKPDEGHRFFARFGCKLFRAGDRQELRNAVARVQGAGLPCQVVELVPGADGQTFVYCVYIDRDGRPGRGLTVRKIRQSPPLFGVARAAELAPDSADLREMTVELARRLDFRGMAAAEFKLDRRDGGMRFMEINGRLVLYNLLLRRGGLDLGLQAWTELTDGAAPRVDPTGWNGVWVNLHADLLHSFFSRAENPVTVGQLAATYRRPLLEAVFVARDPKPFFVQWGRTARRGLSAALRGDLAGAARGAL